MLHVPEEHVYRWIREKAIPAHRVGEHYRLHRSELLEWATARGMRVSHSQFPPPLATATPTVADALEAGGIHAHVPGTDRDSVLRAVVERMPVEPDDREMLFDFLSAREAIGSTGIGDGIAIPHVRSPVVLPGAGASITLCFLESGVDFHAIDGKPVTTLFVVVSPTVRAHLSLLSRLSAALHDAGFKRAVAERAAADVILAEARRLA